MELIPYIALGVSIWAALGVAFLGLFVFRLNVNVSAFEKSTHQVTYVNPFTGKMFDKSESKRTELDIAEIPNMSEADRRRLRDQLVGDDEADNIT